MKLGEVHADVTEKLSGWGHSLAEMLPNVMVAALVIGLSWLLARVACSASDRALRRFDTHQAARDLVARLVRIAVLLAGVMVALGVMNLDKALASILAGAGIIGLALGFAFQDLAGNLISGIGLAIHQRWPFKIGDIVETNDVFSVVEKIYTRTSIIGTLDGKLAVIPNKHIYQSKVINYSASGRRRVDVECGVSYGDDLRTVRRVLREALENVPARDAAREVEVFFSEFGSSSVNVIGRFWIDYEQEHDFLEARSEAVLSIKQAFDENDIVIPFPIRTLDFGIRGGKTLAEVLPSPGSPMGKNELSLGQQHQGAS